MYYIIIPLIIGFILDLIFGDPQTIYHPIRLIGWFINKMEKLIRSLYLNSNRQMFFLGIVLNLVVILSVYIISFLMLYFAYKINIWCGFALNCVMCYQILAIKSLKTESMKVHKELFKNDLQGARTMLSYIVGRDTQNLSKMQCIKAAIETISENTSDGAIAPVVFILIGGAPLGFMYKAINTLDSMVGYKNEKYMYLGKFSAKLDDIVNFIPSRISAIMMIISAFILRYDYKNAYKIYKRDRLNHTSPNSAQTEAVCAGALNIMLAGSNFYGGKLVQKPTIGDDINIVTVKNIVDANRLLYMTSIIALITGIILRGAFL